MNNLILYNITIYYNHVLLLFTHPITIPHSRPYTCLRLQRSRNTHGVRNVPMAFYSWLIIHCAVSEVNCLCSRALAIYKAAHHDYAIVIAKLSNCSHQFQKLILGPVQRKKTTQSTDTNLIIKLLRGQESHRLYKSVSFYGTQFLPTKKKERHSQACCFY